MRAEIRSALGELLEFPSVDMQQIVAWRLRGTFPMHTHISPFGDTFYNSMQVSTLLEELTTVKAMIEMDGLRETIAALGSLETAEGLRLVSFDVESGLAHLVDDLIAICWASRQRAQYELWFVGE